MKTTQNYLVFTDLDGTLLNHEDYTFDAAKPMLEWLKRHDIPVIFTTSKTRRECLLLQEKMGLHTPFIVENGAAICQGDTVLEMLGLPYAEIRRFTERHKEAFGMLPFSDMSVAEVMAHTGFDFAQAEMAKEREFSEPFLLRDETKLAALQECAEAEGFKILKGGRFYHCVGRGQDKGKAVKRLMARYPESVTVGLGDNYNDIDLLEAVEIPVLIPRHDGTAIDYSRNGLIRAAHPGSLGWRESLERVFDVSV